MQLAENELFALLGHPHPRTLKLSARERATLEAARAICERAARLAGDEEDEDFLCAEARLAEILCYPRIGGARTCPRQSR